MQRLLIIPTLIEAYRFVWRERRDFVSLAFPLVAVLSLVGAALVWQARPDEAPTEGGYPVALAIVGLVLGLLSLAFVVMFSVAWHRKYLVAHEASTVAAALRWSPRQTRFLWLVVGLGVIVTAVIFTGAIGPLLLVASASGGAPGPAVLFLLAPAVVGALLVYARLSLLLPAAALDHYLRFRRCWELTQGNGWRLVLIIVLASLPIWTASAVISYVTNGIVGATDLAGSLSANFLAMLIDQATGFVGIAIGVSVLSIAYRQLVVGGPPARAS